MVSAPDTLPVSPGRTMTRKERLKLTDRLTWIALGLSAVSLVTVIFSVFLAVTDNPAPYDPFGEFPVQEVQNRRIGAEGPALAVGEDVLTSATKCYVEAVDVRGVITWTMLEPYVVSIEVAEGNAARQAGCQEFQYANPWPPAAIDITDDLLAAGNVVRWQITGTEEPVQGGVVKRWETQSFTVAPIRDARSAP